MPSKALGVDIGGSGIKGAIVDAASGVLESERHRIATPDPSTPAAVARVVADVARHFDWDGPIGSTYPGVIHDGTVLTAANVDSRWIGVDIATHLTDVTQCPTTVINDADAAGIAEVAHGAAHGTSGTVIVLTLGTGVGSAVFTEGKLVPNTELGHLYFRGGPAEHYVADAVRKEAELDWTSWAQRLTEYLAYVEILFWPELIVLGGGVSKHHSDFLGLVKTRARLQPAMLRNNAGIVGAAMAACGRAIRE